MSKNTFIRHSNSTGDITLLIATFQLK